MTEYEAQMRRALDKLKERQDFQHSPDSPQLPWIRTADRLPTQAESGEVLFIIAPNAACREGIFDGRNFEEGDCTSWAVADVSHWLPITFPQPE